MSNAGEARNDRLIIRIVFTGVMAAIICVISMGRRSRRPRLCDL